MKTYQFAVTKAEAELILTVLGKQPFEVVHGVIGKILEQAKAQDAPAEPTPATSAPPAPSGQ